MPKLGPDVVTELGLRELLELGHRIVVICLKPPVKKGTVFYGLWGIRCVSGDGESDRVLVISMRSSKTPDRPRVFKTLNGVASFLYSLDFGTVCIPMHEGQSATHTPPQDRKAEP